MFDLTTIGEGQLRLTVPRGERLADTRVLRVNAACSEANVAGLLAQLGRRTSWCSVLPQGELAERCLSEFRSAGVDLGNVIRVADGRVALYFMEPGEAPLPSRVRYDRFHTPFREIDPAQIDWDSMLATRLVFVTGITAALTERTARVVSELVDRAVDRGVDVALDVNYRALLWQPAHARRVLEPIARKCRVLFCSRRDAETVFGLRGHAPDAPRLLRAELGAEHVISTDGTAGVYYSGPGGEQRFEVDAVPVIDRPGAGDAFVAGALHGVLAGDVVAGVGYGLRAAQFALTHHGDLTRVVAADFEAAITTDIIR